MRSARLGAERRPPWSRPPRDAPPGARGGRARLLVWRQLPRGPRRRGVPPARETNGHRGSPVLSQEGYLVCLRVAGGAPVAIQGRGVSKSATKAPRAGIDGEQKRGISTILFRRSGSIGAFVADLDNPPPRTGRGGRPRGGRRARCSPGRPLRARRACGSAGPGRIPVPCPVPGVSPIPGSRRDAPDSSRARRFLEGYSAGVLVHFREAIL